MTDPFDDAELIEVETVLTSDRLNIDRGASTPETRDRYAVFKSKPLGSTWQEGDRLYRKGPGGYHRVQPVEVDMSDDFEDLAAALERRGDAKVLPMNRRAK